MEVGAYIGFEGAEKPRSTYHSEEQEVGRSWIVLIETRPPTSGGIKTPFEPLEDTPCKC